MDATLIGLMAWSAITSLSLLALWHRPWLWMVASLFTLVIGTPAAVAVYVVGDAVLFVRQRRRIG